MNSLTVLTLTQELISSSQDKTVRIWSITNKRCLRVLHGHHMVVWCLLKVNVKTKPIIISGSNDSTLRVWNLYDGKCECVLTSQKNRVACLLSI